MGATEADVDAHRSYIYEPRQETEAGCLSNSCVEKRQKGKRKVGRPNI